MCSLKSFCGIEHGAGFEQRDVDAEVGQDFGDCAAAGARSNDHHVVDGRTWSDLKHGIYSIVRPSTMLLAGLVPARREQSSTRPLPDPPDAPAA